MYCKSGNFCVGVNFMFFVILSSLRKFPPRENKAHMSLWFMKEIGVVF